MLSIENLERNQKIKKYAVIAALLLLIILLVIFLIVVLGKSETDQQPAPGTKAAQKSPEQKGKEMTDAIEKANSGVPPVSEEESQERTQDMLKAINAANKE